MSRVGPAVASWRTGFAGPAAMGVKHSDVVIQVARLCVWLKRACFRLGRALPPVACVSSPCEMVYTSRRSSSSIRVVVSSASSATRTSPEGSQQLSGRSQCAVIKQLRHCAKIDSGRMGHKVITLIRADAFKVFHVSSIWLKAQNLNHVFLEVPWEHFTGRFRYECLQSVPIQFWEIIRPHLTSRASGFKARAKRARA